MCDKVFNEAGLTECKLTLNVNLYEWQLTKLKDFPKTISNITVHY
jgi:hypothetical protein